MNRKTGIIFMRRLYLYDKFSDFLFVLPYILCIFTTRIKRFTYVKKAFHIREESVSHW